MKFGLVYIFLIWAIIATSIQASYFRTSDYRNPEIDILGNLETEIDDENWDMNWDLNWKSTKVQIQIHGPTVDSSPPKVRIQ